MNLKELWVRIRALDLTGGAFRSFEGRLGKITSTLTRMKTLVAGVIGGTVVLALQSWITRAGQAADKTVALASALQQTGRYSQGALGTLTRSADALERLTNIDGGELQRATGLLALMADGLSVPELMSAQRAIAAIADQFLGGNMQTAARQLGRTLTTSTNSLARYGIQVSKTASPVERLQQVLKQTEPILATQAERARGLAGAQDAFAKAAGRAQEKAGGLLANILQYEDRTRDATDAMRDFSAAVDENQQQYVRWGRTTVSTIEWVIKTILSLIRIIFNFGQILGDGIAGIVATVNVAVMEMINGAIWGINWLLRQADKIPGVGSLQLPSLSTEGMRAEASGRTVAIEGHLRDMADAVTGAAEAMQDVVRNATTDPELSPLGNRRSNSDDGDDEDPSDDDRTEIEKLQDEVKLLEQGHQLRLLTRQELERALELEAQVNAQLEAGTANLQDRIALQNAQESLGPIAAWARTAGRGAGTTRTAALAQSISLAPLGGTVRLSDDEMERFRRTQGITTPDWRADAVKYAEEVTADAERAKFAVVDNFAYMAEAAISGSAQMSRAIVSGITNILQNLPGVSGFAGSIIGAVGGIVGGLFSRRRSDALPVRVEEYSARAAAVHQRREGPDRVILQVISPDTGETIAQTEYELRRRTRRDAVNRVPTGVRVGQP